MTQRYYHDLLTFSDPVIRAGWRHPLEQYLRFEVALEAVNNAHNISILDVGCGPGDLYGWMSRTGRNVSAYCGVDLFEPSIQLAKKRFPRGCFAIGDILNWPENQSHSLVIASGTFVRGDDDTIDESPRMHHLRKLVTTLYRAADRAVSFIVLRKEVLDAQISQIREPALRGATRDELAQIAHDMTPYWIIREDFFRSDYALYLFRHQADYDAYKNRANRLKWTTHNAVLSHVIDDDLPDVDKAWFWLESGNIEAAAAILYGENSPRCEWSVILRTRLENLPGR